MENIIYLGAGDNLSEEDKKDRLYTIGFVVVIVIVFSVLAVLVGSSYVENSSSASPVKPSITPTTGPVVKSAETTDLIPVRETPDPTASPTPTMKPTPTNTPTATPSPTSVPPTATNTPVPPPAQTPTITSPTKPSVTSTSATLGGNITSDGGATITARGVCIGPSADPTINGTCFSASGTTIGEFTVSATGLTSGTLYYYRAYATNSIGTSYTNDDTFTTP